MAELVELVEDVARQRDPFKVHAGGAGGRVRQGQGLAWLGLTQGAGGVIETAELAARLCPPDVTSGPPPKRTPSAHLTLVRRADETVVETLRAQTHGPLGVGWTIDRLGLLRSHLEPDGARYETLHEATL